MRLYRGFGMVIGSEIELPELSSGVGCPDLIVRRGSVPMNARAKGGEEAFVMMRSTAAFGIYRGGEIVVDEVPDARQADVRSLLLGRVLALLLRQRGWLPLHASCIAVGGEAVLFGGVSGCGKSTTAAAFYRQGYEVISDDIGAIRSEQGVWTALRCWSALKLRSDSLSVLGDCEPEEAQFDKARFSLRGRRVLPDRMPVRRVYILQEAERVSIETASTVEAVRLLAENSFFARRQTPRAVIAAHFRDCAAAAPALTVRRLLRPKSLHGLPEVIAAVEQDLSGQ